MRLFLILIFSVIQIQKLQPQNPLFLNAQFLGFRYQNHWVQFQMFLCSVKEFSEDLTSTETFSRGLVIP